MQIRLMTKKAQREYTTTARIKYAHSQFDSIAGVKTDLESAQQKEVHYDPISKGALTTIAKRIDGIIKLVK
jgi:hypothetical protein